MHHVVNKELVMAVDRYERELEGLEGVEPVDKGAKISIKARRRDLENRITVLKYCLKYPSSIRHEC